MSTSIRFFAVFLPLFGMLVSATASGAQTAQSPFPLSLTITPDDPGIDDRLMLRLSVAVPANRLVNFPRLSGKLGGFSVVGQRALEPEEAEAIETREWVQQYRLEPETTGDLIIPPLTVVVQDPGSLEAVEVQTAETLVHIASIVPPETDLRHIRDILPPASLPSLSASMMPWLLTVLLAILIVVSMLFWRRRSQPVPVRPASQPPHLAALDDLSTLRRAGASDDVSVERFHIKLASILRRYLQDGHDLAAPLKTTEELFADAALAKEPIADCRGLIEQPLGQCDLVKFARHQPSRKAMSEALDHVAAFVERTSVLHDQDEAPADAD